MISEDDGVMIATFRKVTPLEYVKGPSKERSPEEEAEDAANRIIKEIRRLRKQREQEEEARK